MDKLNILNRIKELYSNGENIIQYLRSLEQSKFNSLEDIMISYDFQAGSYIEKSNKNSEFRDKYCSAVSVVINKLGDYSSIAEVGVGEATTLGNVLRYLNVKPKDIFGFDISWSRIKYANSYLKSLNINNAFLTTGDLFFAPYKDNSIDIVYTSHSIEPNGGKEKEALLELYRITNKYLVLLEPAYEFASAEGKERMTLHGYVKNLYSSAVELGYNIIEHRLFDYSSNPLNPTGLIIIKKGGQKNETDNQIACPITKTDLVKFDNVLYSEESLLAFPIIDNIPCLLPQNAIVATHFLDKF